ncbi:3-oxoacyl-ACP reductase FabG [Nocardia sp. NPDC088792]|uniref:3-oxoacyl-ACP reductase FabG n=1 Tax=Nocardia sp. NPDC088792 TaxID=3364332 RepID=UPI0037FDA680
MTAPSIDTGVRPVAVVSGGSRGIGRATVERLAADGFDIAFCYRDRPDAAAEAVAAAERAGARVLAHKADIAEPGEARGLIEAAEAELGEVAAVVACAGIVRDRPLARMTDTEWTDVLHTNLDGTYQLCRAAAMSLMRHGEAAIVTMSSVAGIHGNATQANYAASKAGIIGLTLSLARELGRFGVRANVVAPGLISTDMSAAVTGKARAGLLERITLRRAGEPGEVADLVSFLVSDRARYITGQVIGIDGGLVL